MRLRALVLALISVSGMKGVRGRAEPPSGASTAGRLPPGPFARILGPVRDLAVERLGRTDCRRIFEEVHDFTGRPVARRLESGERSPSSHFARLTFVESSDGPCAANLTAWSVAGDVRVRICSRRFSALAGQDRREAAAVLIHEALHTLGVGEDAANQPLTAYVRGRCGL